MIKKCVSDHYFVVLVENIGVKDSMSFKEVPIQIVDRSILKMRTKEIFSIKVLQRNQKVEEGTLELEDDMRDRYHSLFTSLEGTNFQLLLSRNMFS